MGDTPLLFEDSAVLQIAGQIHQWNESWHIGYISRAYRVLRTLQSKGENQKSPARRQLATYRKPFGAFPYG